MTFDSKVMVKVMFFQKLVKSQGHEVKQIGSNRKVLPQEIHMSNMKALSLLVQNKWPRLSFFSKEGQKSRSRSRNQKFWYQ